MMNKQPAPKGIEWTRIRLADGRELPGATWNPTGGCLHGCTWEMPDGSIAECYAKTIAERFTQAYPQGFEHHYWRPAKLDEPLREKQSHGVFVGSMADLFGRWVPLEQREQVFDVMARADWHVFQVLTKYPRMLKLQANWPYNVWAGISVPSGHSRDGAKGRRAFWQYLNDLVYVGAAARFISFEPLWFDAAAVLREWQAAHGARLPFEWAIIGAASNGSKTYQPAPVHVESLLEICDADDVPVFFKGNLEWGPWRDDFPEWSIEGGRAMAAIA